MLFCQNLSSFAHLQITNARILDGTGGHIEQGWIEIHRGRIDAMGTGQPSIRSVNQLDASGMTVMPGFIDTHRHLFAYADVHSDRRLHQYMRHTLPNVLLELLNAGFTTILSPGDHTPEIFRVRRQLSEGALLGPRLLAAGRMLHAPNDHPASTLCRGNRYCRHKLAAAVTDEAEARVQVARLVDAGADVIKAVHDRELNHRVIIDDALITAMADAARQAKVPFVLHTRDAEDFLRLAKQGVRRMVHTPLVGSLAHNDHGVADIMAQSTLSWASLETLRAQRRTPRASDVARLRQGQENVRYLVDQGMTLAFGTDNPPPLGETSFMTEVRALGGVLSSAEIVQAMTYNAAVFLQREDDLGSIAPGKVADLVLLAGNPLTDITALERVRTVIKSGALVSDQR